MSETLALEIRKIAQKEQAKTFGRLEKYYNSNAARKRRKGRAGDLKDFRRHLTGLLSSFGCVLLRLTHFAQIFRQWIVSMQFGDLTVCLVGNVVGFC